jgi:hypothetical protein
VLLAAVALSDGADSDFVSVVLVELGLLSVLAERPLRLSVMYQPLPLNTIAGGVRTRRAWPPHCGHSCTDGASNPSRFSYRLLQALQR